MIPFRGYQMAAGKKAYKKARFRKRNQRVLKDFLNKLVIVNWEEVYNKMDPILCERKEDNGQDL